MCGITVVLAFIVGMLVGAASLAFGWVRAMKQVHFRMNFLQGYYQGHMSVKGNNKRICPLCERGYQTEYQGN